MSRENKGAVLGTGIGVSKLKGNDVEKTAGISQDLRKLKDIPKPNFIDDLTGKNLKKIKSEKYVNNAVAKELREARIAEAKYDRNLARGITGAVGGSVIGSAIYNKKKEDKLAFEISELEKEAAKFGGVFNKFRKSPQDDILSRYISKDGDIMSNRIALDIKYRKLKGKNIDKVMNDPRIENARIGQTFDKKIPKKDWNKDYLDELPYAAVAESFNKDYAKYLSDVTNKLHRDKVIKRTGIGAAGVGGLTAGGLAIHNKKKEDKLAFEISELEKEAFHEKQAALPQILAKGIKKVTDVTKPKFDKIKDVKIGDAVTGATNKVKNTKMPDMARGAKAKLGTGYNKVNSFVAKNPTAGVVGGIGIGMAASSMNKSAEEKAPLIEKIKTKANDTKETLENFETKDKITAGALTAGLVGTDIAQSALQEKFIIPKGMEALRKEQVMRALPEDSPIREELGKRNKVLKHVPNKVIDGAEASGKRIQEGIKTKKGKTIIPGLNTKKGKAVFYAGNTLKGLPGAVLTGTAGATYLKSKRDNQEKTASENMKDPDVTLSDFIRDGLISEYEAVNQYRFFARKADDPGIKAVLNSIADEEEEHVGELNALLKKLEGNGPDNNEKEGRGEVKKIMQSNGE